MIARDPATERQVQASAPRISTWLTANAGSGKTRVLTDRVARLLLDGVDPQRILCLTYTKAAAAEMQNRLFGRLGDWAMMERKALSARLREIDDDLRLSGARIAEARRLFARAMETPGGLKIQTIHSFCASLLRRFPLEAQVGPHFVEMDEISADLLRAGVVDRLAAGPHASVVEIVAGHVTGADLGALTREIAGRRDLFLPPRDPATIRDLLGVPDTETADRIVADVIGPDGGETLDALATVCAAGSKTDREAAQAIRTLRAGATAGPSALAGLEKLMLFGDKAKTPFGAKVGVFPTKATRAADPDLMDRVDDLMRRVEAGRERRQTFAACERSLALHAFAAAFLPAFETAKQIRGWLDFDDLILKARALLTEPAVAAWVLYRLDGGIDHILVDEAQDTSPVQWEVIEKLAQEFTAGAGAREGTDRTIFVVGDRKQSIYSFQGADPAAVDAMRAQFGARLAAVGTGLQDLSLEYSFRSASPILRLVDEVFDPARHAPLGEVLVHRAHKPDLPGRVDLWPPIEAEEDAPAGDWFDPTDRPGRADPRVRLARAIAGRIVEMKRTETIPVERDGPKRRAVTDGDILILVRGRKTSLFPAIIRECKDAGLAVAGADRLQVGAALAVKDIVAVLSFLALPEDSLSLAAALRSPLFGWTERDLYALTQPRPDGAHLWTALRESTAHPETHAILGDLLEQADFLRPFELIDRLLTRHGGRARLLGRLGDEAEDAIDAFLSQAQDYERVAVPSLTGFLAWSRGDTLEIKRQMDDQGDRIRVMTVHGAKGLEAPIVILPDTAEWRYQQRDQIHRAEDCAVWKMPGTDSPRELRAAQEAAKESALAERRRLLYVAMTRAEKWLIVCAAGRVGTGDESWYSIIEETMRVHAGAEAAEMPTGPGLRLALGDWDGLPMVEAAKPAPTRIVVPDFLRRPAMSMFEPDDTLSPSDLGGAKALPGDPALANEDASLQFGRRIHLLLEHLPTSPRTGWLDMARTLLRDDPPHDLAPLLDLVKAHLDDPSLADLFAPDALVEVPLSAALPDLGGRRIHGAIDRLLLSPGHVRAVDFKTNRLVPDRPEDVPEGLLRQIGAYVAALSLIYADRRVDGAILWTRTRRLMPLPHDLVIAALRRTMP